MNVSFNGVIILIAYVACLFSSDLYELPALKFNKSSNLKRFQTIILIHTNGLTRQKTAATVNTLLAFIKNEETVFGY